MPSVPSRPLQLLTPFEPLREANMNDDGFDKSSLSSDSLESDSETSTITNSPLSCYCSSQSPSNLSNQPTSSSVGENNDLNSLSSDASDADHATEPTQSLEQQEVTKVTKKKKSVGFEPLSTLYVFEDDASGKEEKGFYDINNTWYSVHELKSFRAEAFLTVNWMVMKNLNPQNRKVLEDLQLQDSCSSFHSTKGSKKSETYCYYSNKYGYDRQKEIQNIAEEANYEFCERGIECRTPMGRYLKNKRRVDAMRVVMLYQQMQKQHRRERKRRERRQQQQQYHDDSSLSSYRKIKRHQSNPQALRRIEADIDADALSNVYSSYCKDSASEAFTRGQMDAVAVGMPTSKEIEPENSNKKTRTIDEEDDFMDQIVSLSFGDPDSESDTEDESTTSSVCEDSVHSENSLCLEDLDVRSQHEEEEDPQEVSGVVEVELVEGNEENPHRIHCSEILPPSPMRPKSRRKSWSHPEWESILSCNSLTVQQHQQLKAPPTSASFSSLELGSLFFGAVTGLEWR